MNILFLSLIDYNSIYEEGIYTDLLREFMYRGHHVYSISPVEKRNYKKQSYLVTESRSKILKIKIGNIQKTNNIEKGLTTLTIESKFISAIKKYFTDVKFDLVLYVTPPITFGKVVKYVKSKSCAISYLMLKDIFPQNAVDLGALSKNGIKGIFYKYFRYKEKKLYKISDKIGCMSQANIEYILEHNNDLTESKVEICPNSIEIKHNRLNIDRKKILIKYQIPDDRIVFVYGGNLGKPQDIPFIIECLRTQKNNTNSYFIIVGDGTEYKKLEEFINREKQKNVKLIKRLPKEEYDKLVSACDVGLIFLNHKFTIPNYPSRLLGYTQASLPVFAITDKNTDIGKDIINGSFGWWCESNNVEEFSKKIDYILSIDLENLKKNSFTYMEKNFDVKNTVDVISKSIKGLL